ncbi:hypothetical protein [Mycobacterium sp. JS623]|uniref:hypothetical protein n=1 Tax=Mycobacterium sp. JS623 TaxID=212767 RepID=UPI000307BFF3|nr:hypothetical protein [Mycobacterium sp. JS623]
MRSNFAERVPPIAADFESIDVANPKLGDKTALFRGPSIQAANRESSVPLFAEIVDF